MSLLIGLDIGTTTTKALAFDPELGKVVHVVSCSTPVDHLDNTGASEHDPDRLWQSTASCLHGLMSSLSGQQIAGLAISSFGDTGVALDSQGRTLGPMMAWYDQRCAVQVAALRAQISPEKWQALTGLRFSTSVGVSKWLWLRDEHPQAAQQMSWWMPVSSYLLWQLTGEVAVDFSIASRMGLFDQNTLDWSNELLDLVGLQKEQLPAAFPAGTRVGSVGAAVADLTGLPEGTPCFLGGHDHLCAALATGVDRPGTLIDSCDTAWSLLVSMPGYIQDVRLQQGGYACYAHVIPGRYILRGGLRSAGGAIQWLGHLLSGSAGEIPYKALVNAAAQTVGKQAGPVWMPHWMGSGTPLNDSNSLAALVGLHPAIEPGDLFRGLLESLAFWLRQNVETLEPICGNTFGEIIAIGGTTRLDLFPLIKANVLNRPVALLNLPEPASVGAALLAGKGCGYFEDAAGAAKAFAFERKILEPDLQLAAWYEQIYQDVFQHLYSNLKETNLLLGRINRRVVQEEPFVSSIN